MNGIKKMHKDNHIVTIFGGTGDLTYRKLLPAFYNLKCTGNFPDHLHIVVIGRQPLTSESYRDLARPWLQEHSRIHVSDDHLDAFLNHVTYFEMTFTEDEGYERLFTRFQDIDANAKKLYYFAVAPSFFEIIAQKLEKHNLAKDSKIIIEKPFGNDLKSAESINHTLSNIFDEDHIYRIDHYVAKEMVQNIFTIRFANEIFKNIWNADNIANIQISANELVGVENRGNYYDHTGALKDMFQNHLLQILSIVTMDKPETMDATSIHEAQEAILDNLYIENMDQDVIFGQYTQNQESMSYRDEDKVDEHSRTETFVALKLGIRTPRWRNTPIYVRTGKRMHKRITEVVVEFKQQDHAPANVLIIKIQPEEGIYLRFNIKKPGQSHETQSVLMDFCQSCDYENRMNTPEAYERLLNAALEDDHSLFASFNQVKRSWAFVEDIIRHHQGDEPETYPAFTNGPQGSHDLLARDGFTWIEYEIRNDAYDL
ncbi:glucose-6-phosphate dehydrogenase [Erysipelothrix anatis]|uniref:glucose-6-phosphate dehydrogenase n=1 Tax=Erysipelothrix anatis TaxID=2683713 RepID=UPI001F4772A9|nr:glucose-6-phosphate dehydrogenase [Erysipelothrix anatis]